MRHHPWIARAALVVVGSLLRPGIAAGDPVRLHVLTTTTDLREIARAVGGERVEVESLLKGPEDPHFLSVKPSFVRRAHAADLFVKTGMDLEIGYEVPIVRDARNPRIQPGEKGHLDASVGVERLDVPEGPVDRSMGDVHPHGNPHYLTDPVQAKVVAASIADAMAALDPPGADGYRSRAKGFSARLDEAMFGAALLREAPARRLERMLAEGTLGAWIAERKLESAVGGWAALMLPHSGAPVAEYHATFTYLCHRFHLEPVARLEPKPGIPPTPRHLEGVVSTMKSRGARVVLRCPFQPAETVESVAGRAGGRALLLAHEPAALGEDGQDYVAFVDANVRALAAALRGSGGGEAGGSGGR